MSWTDDKAGMEKVSEVSSPPSSEPIFLSSTKPTFRARLKSHFRRFWWAHLIFAIASALIIVLCLIYVAFPRKAQHDLNRSTLKVESLTLTNPTSNSFHLLQNSTVGNPTAYHPRLDAFNASLSLDGGRPYAMVELPKIHATKTATSIIDQEVKITDLDAFTDYNIAILNQEEVRVNVKGRTGLHEMRFPKTDVDYDKTVTIKGLNKLIGFNVTSFSIMLAPDPDGTNMIGEVYIPNPSVLNFTMGNVTFENKLPAMNGKPAVSVGNSTLSNLVLAPGNNTVPMRSIINQTLVIEALANTYKDGLVPFDIVGLEAVYNGQHLTYYEKALQGLTQHVTLDVGGELKRMGVDASTLAGLGAGTPP